MWQGLRVAVAPQPVMERRFGVHRGYRELARGVDGMHRHPRDEAAFERGEVAPGAPVLQGQVGPAIGVHVGPGALGVMAVRSPDAASA